MLKSVYASKYRWWISGLGYIYRVLRRNNRQEEEKNRKKSHFLRCMLYVKKCIEGK